MQKGDPCTNLGAAIALEAFFANSISEMMHNGYVPAKKGNAAPVLYGPDGEAVLNTEDEKLRRGFWEGHWRAWRRLAERIEEGDVRVKDAPRSFAEFTIQIAALSVILVDERARQRDS